MVFQRQIEVMVMIVSYLTAPDKFRFDFSKCAEYNFRLGFRCLYNRNKGMIAVRCANKLHSNTLKWQEFAI